VFLGDHYSNIHITKRHLAPLDIKELQDALDLKEADVLDLKKEGGR
jgi:hypothetical protein